MTISESFPELTTGNYSFSSQSDLTRSFILNSKIKVWDLAAALDPRSPAGTLCLRTLIEHTGRVFRLQFDDFQIVSSSHDDTILIWDFLSPESPSPKPVARTASSPHKSIGIYNGQNIYSRSNSDRVGSPQDLCPEDDDFDAKAEP